MMPHTPPITTNSTLWSCSRCKRALSSCFIPQTKFSRVNDLQDEIQRPLMLFKSFFGGLAKCLLNQRHVKAILAGLTPSGSRSLRTNVGTVDLRQQFFFEHSKVLCQE